MSTPNTKREQLIAKLKQSRAGTNHGAEASAFLKRVIFSQTSFCGCWTGRVSM